MWLLSIPLPGLSKSGLVPLPPRADGTGSNDSKRRNGKLGAPGTLRADSRKKGLLKCLPACVRPSRLPLCRPVSSALPRESRAWKGQCPSPPPTPGLLDVRCRCDKSLDPTPMTRRSLPSPRAPRCQGPRCHRLPRAWGGHESQGGAHGGATGRSRGPLTQRKNARGSGSAQAKAILDPENHIPRTGQSEGFPTLPVGLRRSQTCGSPLLPG